MSFLKNAFVGAGAMTLAACGTTFNEREAGIAGGGLGGAGGYAIDRALGGSGWAGAAAGTAVGGALGSATAASRGGCEYRVTGRQDSTDNSDSSSQTVTKDCRKRGSYQEGAGGITPRTPDGYRGGNSGGVQGRPAPGM